MTTDTEETSDEEPPLRAVVADGTLLSARFRVHNLLGRPGTTAFSLRATDEVTDEQVVCKIPRRVASPAFESLLDQYRFLRKLKSTKMPAPVGFFWESGANEVGPFPFLVLEFVPGEAANTWFRGTPLRRRLQMFLDVLDAVADLNDRGVEHGDVHLKNVIVTQHGGAVLIDPDPGHFTSSGAARIREDGSVADLRCIKNCLQELLAGENPSVAAGIMERLECQDTDVPNARHLGMALRSILASTLLPGETSEALEDSASRFKNETTGRDRLYRANHQIRDLEFRRIRDLLIPMADTYGFKSASKLAIGSSGCDSRVQAQQPSDSSAYGCLEELSVTCQSLDGDKLYFSFSGTQPFRKPWHDTPGLISKGQISVVWQDVPRAILVSPIELWLGKDAATLSVREVGALVPFVPADLERALRVLAGHIYPGVPEPIAIPPGPPTVSIRDERMKLRSLLDLGISFRRDAGGEGGLGLALLQLALALPPNHAHTVPFAGTRFHELTAVPTQQRHQLVVEETTKVLAFVGDNIRCLRRFDVRPNDESARTLLFDIEGNIDGGNVRTTFQVDNDTVPRRVNVLPSPVNCCSAPQKG